MSAAVHDYPEEAGRAPTTRPPMGDQKLTGTEGPSIAPDNACDEPSPYTPCGYGKKAIATDPVTGEGYDKVYGVRPKTTWHLKPAAERNLWEFIASMDLAPDVCYAKRDTSEKLRGPPPTQPIWKENVFILTTASLAPLLHTAWNAAFPDHTMHWAPAWVMYHTCFILFAIALIKRLHWYMAEYGTLDEQNRGRDMVDDKHVNHLGQSVFIYTIFRTLGPFLLAWRGDMTNIWSGLSWATPLKIGWWEIALDYWFYLYHRSCHEFDVLWFVHRQHHATKHPTPVLSILADDYQEVLEVFIVPFLATAISPKMNFIEMWLVICYTIYVEALGHSGIRAYWAHPVLGAVLAPFGMELTVEDHSNHHLYGKAGMNYGKQTRVWDRLFGTVDPRRETQEVGIFAS